MEALSFLEPRNITGKIRIGPNKDGGYVLHYESLMHTDILLSYGVGWDTAFEEDFNKFTGKGAILFDPTMFGRYLVNVDFLFKLFLNFQFKKIILYLKGVIKWYFKLKELSNNNIKFINEGISTQTSHKIDTFKNHLKKHNLLNKDVLLKIDIEGYEYLIFSEAETYQYLKNVSQILIEFHDLKNNLNLLRDIIFELSKTHILIHIHANNFGGYFTLFQFLHNQSEDYIIPDVIEMTFVRIDKVSDIDHLDTKIDYPIKNLDYPNDPRHADFSIDFF